MPGNEKHRYKHLRACLLLRRFAKDCNAVHSHTLRGTILRKHIATYCIQLNLTDTDVSDLATFMGHADKIHKEHYRQPLASRDILKISQYLEAVQGNIQTRNNTETSSSSDNNISATTNINENDEIENEIENENLCLSKYAKTTI